MSILKDTNVGEKIIKNYEENQIFSEEVRVLLLNTIAKYIDVKGYRCTLTDCSNIEQQICKVFPTEQLSYYNIGKRGKLYNKLHNLKRQTKPLMKENISKDQEPVCNDEPDAEFSIKCLRNDTITMDELDIYWRKCSNYRLNQIKKLSTTLDILNEWPEYKKPSGYQVVCIYISI
ncbi:uncharacterized protein LOC124419663 [Lucilia cuprina]|uniref:uncharacterized protein LOC124419663 n=1 Tax=Lucilia cuprina TaxID=7375 RepID=UPI001F06A1FD|nr:uncharacterized protein LOC124419663 [Lucilia cuprina]